VPRWPDRCAQRYAGHQFCNITQLGDGRRSCWNVLDQSGCVATSSSGIAHAYSRGATGCLLGPVATRYVGVKRCHALGITNDTCLAAVQRRRRDYAKRPEPVPVLTASPHQPFARDTLGVCPSGRDENLRRLTDYAIHASLSSSRWSLDCAWPFVPPADLIAGVEMPVALIHEVMNTDNCAISRNNRFWPLCLYGRIPTPMVFSLDRPHKGACYAQPSPQIGMWNMAHLAASLCSS